MFHELFIILVFKLEFGSRAKDKAVSELTEEEKNVKALKRCQYAADADLVFY